MTTERNDLLGNPSNRLVRDVRRILWQHLRSRPDRRSEIWKLTWEWANNIRYQNHRFVTKGKPRWPLPHEIATQYIFLALAAMRDSRVLKMPYYAPECVPENLTHRMGLLSGLMGAPGSDDQLLIGTSQPEKLA